MDFPNLDSSVFKIDMPTGRPRRGALLVAEPFLKEECFSHAVISLIDCEKGERPMGLVLNHRSDCSLGQVIRGINDDVTLPLHLGGPVATDHLFYLHTLPLQFPGSKEIGNGLYIGGDFEMVCDYVNAGRAVPEEIRFFVGYAGWDATQLDEEISHHVWAVAPAPGPDEIFATDGDPAWHRAVRALGPAYRHWLYHPLHPQLN